MIRSLASLSPAEQALLRRQSGPRWQAPMLATLTEERFSSADWLFERKLDGERCLVLHDLKSTGLFSRNHQPLNGSYPELAEAARAACPVRYVADGEVVAFRHGHTSFARLQQRMSIKDAAQARKSPVGVYLYLFDLLHLDGFDLTRLPLRARKKLLREAFHFRGRLRFTPHRNGRGERYYDEACRKGWEGLIAKRADGAYVHRRSPDWLKMKCARQQELVIGGYTEPEGARHGFGALLLGYFADGALRYAGRVGTGFDHETLAALAAVLRSRRTARCPFKDRAAAQGKGVNWVKPALVAEIGYTEWTRDGRLRHPRYLGLRRDKAPREVVREAAPE